MAAPPLAAMHLQRITAPVCACMGYVVEIDQRDERGYVTSSTPRSHPYLPRTSPWPDTASSAALQMLLLEARLRTMPTALCDFGGKYVSRRPPLSPSITMQPRRHALRGGGRGKGSRKRTLRRTPPRWVLLALVEAQEQGGWGRRGSMNGGAEAESLGAGDGAVLQHLAGGCW